MSQVDVAIVGGGPAGVSQSLSLLQHGLSVAIIDGADPSDSRLGENLSAEAMALLGKLQIDKVISEIPSISCQEIKSVWGNSELRENHSIFNPYGISWNIDKNEFDNALLAVAERAGAKVFRQTMCSSVLQNGDKWDLTLRLGHDNMHLGAKFLVDATGRSAKMARMAGAKLQVYDNQIAIIGVAKIESIESSLIIEAIEDGWWYVMPLPNNELLAAFMTDSDLIRNSHESLKDFWLGRMQNTLYASEIIGELRLFKTLQSRDARMARLDRVYGTRWIAIGDAAYTLDPLSGDGIRKAIESGIESANYIVKLLQDDENCLNRYSERTERAFNDYLIQRHDYYNQERRWPEAPFWRRRQHPLNLETVGD